MRQWLYRMALCLVVGCVTTVTVSWACAARYDIRLAIGGGANPDYSSPRRELTGESSSGDVLFVFVAWHYIGMELFHFTAWPPRSGLTDDTVSAGTPDVPGWSQFREFDVDGLGQPIGQVDVASGWPMLSMVGSYHYPDWRNPQTAHLEGAIDLDGSGDHSWGINILPLRPILTGFLVDTLFYGLIWFVIFFGLGKARHAIRTKRGQCPKCAYQLRGQVDGGCSECGWNRS